MAEKFKYDNSYFEKINNAIEQLNIIASSEVGIVSGLLDLLRSHDIVTYNHTLIVADIALNLAMEARLDPDECAKVKNGALLHDIGKLFVPKELLQRHNGDYVSKKQTELLKSHGKMGQAIIHSFVGQEGRQKLDMVYELIADQHNIGIGKVESPQEDVDRRNELVPYISIADFIASALDDGKMSLRTFEYDEATSFINRRMDRGLLPTDIRAPFNSLMRRIGPLSYDTAVSANNLYSGKNYVAKGATS